MIDRARESRNPKKVIRVTLMESYGEIGRVPVNLSILNFIQWEKPGYIQNLIFLIIYFDILQKERLNFVLTGKKLL